MKISKHLLFSILTCLYVYSQVTLSDNQNIPATVDVGLILDLNTTVGEMTKTCIVMAIEDFYASHSYKTRIKLHIRDSKGEAVEAASAAIDLLKNVQVKSILGPIHSTQADFVADIGNKSQVPILSFSATSPSLSHTETPYFIRIARNDISQVKAIAAIIKAFGWREIVPIYEDTNYGRGIISYLTDALQEAGARVSQQTVISPLARDDQIFQQLYKLMTKQTRVFVVHMSPSFASRIFSKAKEAGMMSKGYVWIVTDGIATMLNSKEASSGTDLMQGVIGVKPFIPNTQKLENFNERWKQRFHLENPGMKEVELNAFGVWAYDSIYALALAIERVGASMLAFRKPDVQENLTDLTEIGTFQTGPKLLESILNTRFSGLSGEFEIIDGQIQSSTYNIVNVVGENEKEIGLWSPTDVFSKDSLADVEWPGRSIVVPKGWEIPTSEKKLKIGVPLKSGFNEFIKVERDPHTRAPMVTGFCVDVFNAVLNILPYNVPYEFIPFETYEGSGQSAGNYDDLVRKVYDQTFDAVVGDITIVKNRLEYADFTLPFTESGVSLIVPFKDDEKRNAWIFMKPLTADLWITTGVLFLYTGFVVWVLEHRVNTQFRGSRIQQLGIIFWFSFSTLVFAHSNFLILTLKNEKGNI